MDAARIELEALLTERAGMDAENEGRARRGESPAYGSDHYYELAERIRALLAQAEPKAPLTMREQAQLDNYGYEKEDIEKGEMTAGQEKLCRDLDKVIDILEEKPAPSATEEEHLLRHFDEWMDCPTADISDVDGEYRPCPKCQAIRSRLTASTPPAARPMVSRKDVDSWANELDSEPTYSEVLGRDKTPVERFSKPLCAMLREAGVEVEEKP